MSIIKLDLPLPETPEMQQNNPNGSFKSIFFKLLVVILEKVSTLEAFFTLLFLAQ